MDELVHIHMLLNLRKIRESKMNWVAFYQIVFGSLYVAGKLPTHPSPKIVSVKKKIVSAIHSSLGQGTGY